MAAGSLAVELQLGKVRQRINETQGAGALFVIDGIDTLKELGPQRAFHFAKAVVVGLQRFAVQHGQIKSFTAEDYRNALDLALQKISSFDIMPPDLLQKAGLPSFLQSARMMHHPQSWRDVQTAKKRAVFDDLMYLAVKLQLNHAGSDSEHGAVCNDLTLQQAYLASLPYALTNGQKQAIDTVSAQMAGGRRINCLIQGDVGTGKTCVAFALLLQAAGSGYQGALAVPYTTLAWQHYRDLSEIAKNAGLKQRKSGRC